MCIELSGLLPVLRLICIATLRSILPFVLNLCEFVDTWLVEQNWLLELTRRLPDASTNATAFSEGIICTKVATLPTEVDLRLRCACGGRATIDVLGAYPRAGTGNTASEPSDMQESVVLGQILFA